MNDIKTLKEIGLKEVSRKTYIEVKYLQKMIDKDFEGLNKTNILGFVQILKREYNLNLDDWVEEFEEYLNNNVDSNTPEQLFIDTRPSFWQKKLNLFLVVIFVILIGGFLYSYFYNKGNNLNIVSVGNNTSTILSQAAENLENITMTEDNIAQNTIPEEIENPNETSNGVANLTTESLTVINDTVSDRVVNSSAAAEFSNLTLYDVDDNTSIVNMSKMIHKIAVIKPDRKLWLGIINLEDFSKRDYTISNFLDIDLTKEQLILTGHSFFNIENANGSDSLNFNTADVRRLVVKDGAIKEISGDEFRALNRGRNW